VVPDTEEAQRTVIVVDDSDEVRDILTQLLEGEGYKVLPVEDGETALLMTRRVRPALITLDIHLPREDGHEILRRLKANPDTSAIPVLVVSGQADLLELGDRLGADAILAKPFDLADMQRLVSSLIRRAS
jgi:CheY-like chemotaxis protein